MAEAKTKAEERDYDEITYVPDDRDDPVTTTWNGFKFVANRPVRVPKKTTIQVLLRQERTIDSGEVVSRSVEKRIPMVDQARTNHKFSVNGEAPITKLNAHSRIPQTPDEYRGWATKWISDAVTVEEMDTRWAGEQRLRESCGVDDRDVARIRPYFEAQRALNAGEVTTFRPFADVA